MSPVNLSHADDEFDAIDIGDDETDEDAFAVVAEHGIGIVVAEEHPNTQARYYLRNPAEVGDFLDRIYRIVTLQV